MTTAAIDRTRRSELRELAGRVSWLGPLAALVVFQQIFFPAPMGIVLNGALVGGRIALIALGIALVYRANRIVNFAQGDLGAVPAVLGVMLVVAWGWSYWFGLFVGLLAAVLLGVLVEGLIIRRFFTAPRLVLTVATIGLSQLLAGAGLFLPRAFGDQSFGTRLPQPFDASWVFGGVTFNANDIFTMIVVPVCLLALALFLQRSTVGIAIVGAAERADRAFTLGIPVKRLHTVVWVVASVLAFLAMFLRAGAVGLPIGEVLAPIFLVQALAAAVFGRFERFTTIAAAAIGLGIVDQAMTFQSGNKEANNVAVLFGIVLVGLLVTRGGTGTGRVDSDASATWQAIREMRPVPREMRRLPEVVVGAIGAAGDRGRVRRVAAGVAVDQPPQPGHDHRDLRHRRRLAGRAHRLGRAGQPGPDGVRRRGRVRGRRAHRPPRLGPGAGDAGRRPGRRRGRRDRRLPGAAPARADAGGVDPGLRAVRVGVPAQPHDPVPARPAAGAADRPRRPCSASSCRARRRCSTPASPCWCWRC